MKTRTGRSIRLCATGLLLVVVASQTVGAQDTLVATGSLWKYLDDGSDQGTAWYQPKFDDSGWASGPAELGYGDGGEATVVRYGPDTNNRYITAYFRHTFTVSDPANYPSLLLKILRDDGAVVYLNGAEVFRTNMPEGAITCKTPASRAVGGPDEGEFIETPIDANSLVAGENVLAVEVHQDRPNSTDISFDLSLEVSTAAVPQKQEEETLIGTGSSWKYLDDGSDQGTAWHQPKFDDSAWPSGPAELGYGDGGEATVLHYGPDTNNKYITTYFRHTFTVADPEDYPNLLLKILRDDGAVVYLNGVEVFRTNMPEGTVTYKTLASSAVGGPDEGRFIETPLDVNSLLAVENVLAVEIHQDRANSTDISLDLALMVATGGKAGPVTPTVTKGPKGPYLFYPGDNTRMQVLWQLLSPEAHTLRWGRDTTYSEGNVTPTMYGDNQYEHLIAGLTPGAKYYYQVEGVGSGSFLAAPLDDAADVKFLVFGDTQGNPAVQDQVNTAMVDVYTKDPKYQTLTLQVGDMSDRGDESGWTNQVFSRSRPNTVEIQANLPINACTGNHDDSAGLYQKYWPYPYESGGLYWSFDYGPAHIVVLELPWEYSSLGDAQRAWLEADFAASRKGWKFLLFHAPLYSADGFHPNNIVEQAYVQSLCEKYQVSMVFNGHNHYYAHCQVNGVHHITTGGGGASLRTFDLLYDPSIVKAVSAYHFCKVDIHGPQLDFQAVGLDGAVIDEFTIHSPPPK